MNLHNFVITRGEKAKKGHQTASAPAGIPSTSSKPKKNRPMKKEEQEAKIRDLKNQLGRLSGTTGYEADSPGEDSNAAEHDESSGDDDSEESEED